MIRNLLKKPIVTALAFSIFPIVQILWEHTHGGVVTHYLLHREDMPSFSNWWGLLTIPLLAFVAITLIRRRYTRAGVEGLALSKADASLVGASKADASKADASKAGDRASETSMDKAVVAGFLGGLIYGGILASFWAFNLADLMPYMLLVPLALAFFLPAYRWECLLGFVLAMSWTFGGVLPVAIGFLLLFGAWVIHKGIRGGILKLMGRA